MSSWRFLQKLAVHQEGAIYSSCRGSPGARVQDELPSRSPIKLRGPWRHAGPALNSFPLEGAFDPGPGNKSRRRDLSEWNTYLLAAASGSPLARENREGKEGKGRKRRNDRELRAGFADRSAH